MVLMGAMITHMGLSNTPEETARSSRVNGAP
jgi:hypothetical protein